MPFYKDITTHKPEIPLRLTISGIGSEPYKITKSLAKILTPLSGSISSLYTHTHTHTHTHTLFGAEYAL